MSGLAAGGGVQAGGYPAWYTAPRLLTLFCWVTFLVFLDRGVLASNGVNQGLQVGSATVESSSGLVEDLNRRCGKGLAVDKLPALL